MYVCLYVMHVCMYVCNVCVYAYMYVCMYICMYVCMYCTHLLYGMLEGICPQGSKKHRQAMVDMVARRNAKRTISTDKPGSGRTYEYPATELWSLWQLGETQCAAHRPAPFRNTKVLTLYCWHSCPHGDSASVISMLRFSRKACFDRSMTPSSIARMIANIISYPFQAPPILLTLQSVIWPC